MFNHKQIRRFDEYGEIADDKYLPGIHQTILMFIVEQMREQGYVRRLEIPDDWTTSYNGRTYYFKISVYGVYVGKRKAQWIEGMDGTNIIQRPKSKTLSKNLGSESVTK